MPVTTPSRLGRRTVAVVALAYATIMAGTTLPTPLYPLLQNRYGLSTAASTQLFAIYAIAVLVGLILFGAVSDWLGRKPVAIAAAVTSAASGIVYATAAAAPTLYVARSLSGVSAALVTGTATAFLVDSARSPVRGAAVATAANMIGLGLGPLFAAAVASALPGWTMAPFALHAVLVTAAALLLLGARESIERRQRQTLLVLPGVPRAQLPEFSIAIATSIGFVVMGSSTAITAILIMRAFHIDAVFVVGLIASTLFFSTAGGQLLGRRLGPRWPPFGYGLLLTGTLAVAASATMTAGGPAALYLCGLVLVGLGHGVLFPGGLELLMVSVPRDVRGRAGAAYWAVAYGFTAVGAVILGGVCSALGDRDGVAVFGFALTALTVTVGAVGVPAVARRRQPVGE